MQKKIRNSNFEVLRIVAMCMIIIHHIIVHCVSLQCSGVDTIFEPSFTTPEYYSRFAILDIGAFIGPVGNGIFILISGYFLCCKENVDIIKTSKKIISQVLFATIILMLSTFVIYHKYEYSNGYVGMSNMTYITTLGWFASYYFTIVVIGKLFLNKFLSGFSRKSYLEFMLISFVAFSFTWTAIILNDIASGLRVCLTGVFLYSLGGYIKKYDPFKNARGYAIIVALIISMGLVVISSYNMRILNIEQFIKSGNPGPYYPVNNSEFSSSDFLVLLVAVLLFELFRRIKIKSNRVINYIASSTFMIYLIHDSDPFRTWWRNMDWAKLLYESPKLFLISLFKWMVITFAIGFAAYILYQFVCFMCSKLKFLVIKEPKVMETEE